MDFLLDMSLFPQPNLRQIKAESSGEHNFFHILLFSVKKHLFEPPKTQKRAKKHALKRNPYNIVKERQTCKIKKLNFQRLDIMKI